MITSLIFSGTVESAEMNRTNPSGNATILGAVAPRYGEVQIRDRGYLPHWEKDSGLYFVTFRLVDSLPEEVLEKIANTHQIFKTAKRSGIKLSPLQEALVAEYSPKKLEEYMDSGAGACYLRDPRAASVTADALRSADKRKYRLIAWCIMPNHVHVVFRVFPGRRLTEVLKSWKSYSARRANRILGREGAFWQREYYDRLIRNGGELDRAIRYVVSNPERAGLKGWRWVWSEEAR
jgi:REP element-mobilizing transposase RayT